MSRAAASQWDRALALLDRIGFDENALLLTFAVVVAICAAGGVVLFYATIDASHLVLYEWPTRFLPRMSLTRPILTALAIGVAATIWRRIGAGSDGLTVPDVQLSVVRRGGRVSARKAIGRTLASAATIGGGGSAGSEGPVAVLGAAAGSFIGKLFRFSPDRMRVLVGAGAAAGIAAAFNAPLAGAFFALEEIVGSFRTTTFAPIVVASVVGAVVARAVFGNHPAFPIPQQFGVTSAAEVAFFFPVLGVVCGVMSAFFVRLYFTIGSLVARVQAGHPFRAAATPWITGLVVGLIVLASQGLLVGSGHLAIPLAAFGGMAWWLLLMLAVGKVIVTSLTLQGGGSGGVFTPSLFVGAATGGSVGVALHALLPGSSIAPEAYALVGMGAVVATTTAAPLTAILLVFEITGDYGLVPALMVSVVISQFVARPITRDNLYSGWLRRRGEHLQHGADRDALRSLAVRHAFETSVIAVPEAEPVHKLLEHLGRTSQEIFPVVDDERHLVGVFTMSELATVARADRAVDAVLLAADLAQPSEVASPDESLLAAVRRMGMRGVGALPVVDATTGAMLGIVSRASVLAVYERSVTEAAGGSEE